MKVQDQSEHELLRRYSREGCGEAFGELVRRNAGMVRSVALRKTGSPHEAEEVAQVVFTVLARKSGTLGTVGSLGAWLHRVAVLESRKMWRKKQREQRNLAMIREHSTAEDTGLNRVREEVDEAIERMAEDDRNVLMLHYVEGRTYQELAERLSTTAEGARKRCSRALEKLTAILRRKGVIVPAAALGAWLGHEFAPAAGAAGTAALAQASLAKAGGGTGGSILLFVTTMKVITAGSFALGLLLPFCWEMGSGAEVRRKDATGKMAMNPGRGDDADDARHREPVKFDLEMIKKAFARHDGSADVERWREVELRKLMFALNADELGQVLEVLKDVRNKPRFSGVACALFARWAELDGPGAIEAALACEGFGKDPLRGAFVTWAAADEKSALAWLGENREPRTYDLCREWIRWKAGSDAGAAGESVKLLAEIFPEKKRELYRDVMQDWALKDGPAAAKWAAAERDPVLRDDLLAQLVKGFGELGGLPTLEFAKLISDTGKKESVLSETLRWTGVRGGYRMMKDLKEGGFSDDWSAENLRKFSAGLMVNRPERWPELIDMTHGDEQKQRIYEGVLEGIMWNDPHWAEVAANEVSDDFVGSERGGKAFGDFARRWIAKDREGAKAWTETLAPGLKRDIAYAAWAAVGDKPATDGEEGR